MAIVATPGAVNANSYNTLAEIESYFDGRVGADAWYELSAQQDEAAIQSTRMLDQYDYVGSPVNEMQALKWPRTKGGITQVETATVVGTITGDGDVAVVLTAAGLTGSPITLAVPVLTDDTAAEVATKIRAALNANSVISAFFTIGGTGAAITLARTKAAGNDTTLNLSIDNGTCTGLTASLTSTDTTEGMAGDLVRNYATNVIPAPIKNAQCEIVLWLLSSSAVIGSGGSRETLASVKIEEITLKYNSAQVAAGFVDGLPIEAARLLAGLRLPSVLA